MEGSGFDRVARHLARPRSRRTALRASGLGQATALLGHGGLAGAADQRRDTRHRGASLAAQSTPTSCPEESATEFEYDGAWMCLQPYALCTTAPCEIDPLDPALATCQCKMVETGPTFTFGGGCDVSQCSATIWSGAAPTGVTQYLPAMQCLNRNASFPEVCPAGTPVPSPAGTPASA